MEIKFIVNNGLMPCNNILVEKGVKDCNELLQLITHNQEIAAQNLAPQNRTVVQNAGKSTQTVKHAQH